MKKSIEREKTLKVGHSIVIVSPTLIDISKVVKVDKKTKSAILANGLMIDLFYKKDMNIRTLNSNIKYLAVLKKGPLANKYIIANELLTNMRLFTNLVYQVSLDRYEVMQNNSMENLVKLNELIVSSEKEFSILYNPGLPF